VVQKTVILFSAEICVVLVFDEKFYVSRRKKVECLKEIFAFDWLTPLPFLCKAADQSCAARS
jgi:hypothetical protein